MTVPGHLRAAWTSAGGGPAPAEDEPASVRALLALILGCGLIVRVLHAWRGLPYLHSWDEPFIVSKALDMLKHGTLDPEYFVYGTLPIYLSMAVGAVHYLWLMGRPATHPPFLSHIDQITTYYDTGWFWEISHPTFYLWSRWMAALIGAGTVLMAYLIARRLAGRWAGLGAAAFLAFLPFHVEHSSIATVDSPMTFFVMLAAWGAIRFAESVRTGYLFVSLASCGLAASCKYTGALSVVMPALALGALTPRLGSGRRWLGWLAVPSLPSLAFLAGTPYALLNMRTFLIDVGRAVRVYEATPWEGARVNPGLEHLLLQAGHIAGNLGPVALVVVLLGAARLATRRPGWIVAAYAVAHAVFMGRTELNYHRNFLVLYPLAAVAFGAGSLILLRALHGLAAGAAGPRRLAPAAGTLLVAILLGWPLLVTAREGVGHAFGAETRTEAAGLAARVVAKAGSRRVAVPLELRMHPSDLERIGGEITVAPYLDLLCGGQEYDHILVPARWSAYTARWRLRSDLFQRLEPGGVASRVSTGGVAPLLIEAPSLNPEVEILTLEQAPERASPCLAAAGPDDLTGSASWLHTGSGELMLHVNGHVATGWYLADRGAHAVVVEARGTRAGGEPARIRISALARGEGGAEEVLGSEELALGREKEIAVLTFQMPAEGLTAARVEFFNDFYDAASQASRDVYLTRIMILELSAPPGG